MRFRFSVISGWATILIVLFVPATLVAYFANSARWLVIVPLCIVAFAVFVAALPLKRTVTAEQFADELESHLLGTGGEWDWDDTTSVAIADARLEKLRRMLPKFDSLKLELDRVELESIIEALRRGEFPECSPPKNRVDQ